MFFFVVSIFGRTNTGKIILTYRTLGATNKRIFILVCCKDDGKIYELRRSKIPIASARQSSSRTAYQVQKWKLCTSSQTISIYAGFYVPYIDSLNGHCLCTLAAIQFRNMLLTHPSRTPLVQRSTAAPPPNISRRTLAYLHCCINNANHFLRLFNR